jgi:exonuclease VII large subunit
LAQPVEVAGCDCFHGNQTLAQLLEQKKNMVQTLAQLLEQKKNMVQTLAQLLEQKKNMVQTLAQLLEQKKNMIHIQMVFSLHLKPQFWYVDQPTLQETIEEKLVCAFLESNDLQL